MPDLTQTTSTSPYYAAGQVSLPNDGQILSTDTPDASEINVQPAPATSGTSVQPQANPVVQPTQPTQAATGQSGQSGQPGQLSKQPTQAASSIQSAPALHPSVKRAGILSEIAQTLSGGPRYDYNVDPKTGEMQKTPVPVRGRDIAMAIALEALSGSLAGLGQKGTNAAGKAAGVGLQQGQQIAQERQKQQQQAQQTASQDLSRQFQIADTNMRMYANARSVGMQNQANNEEYIAEYKPLVDRIQKDYPGYVKGIVGYSDLAKYHIASENAIPYSSVPRLDAQGQQVEINGIPQWDIKYMILDPSFKAAGMLSDKDIKTLQEMGRQGADNEHIGDSPANATFWLNQKAQISGYQLGKQSLTDFYNTLNSGGNTLEGLKEPTITDSAVNTAAETAAQKYNVPVALVKGIINQESGGNPNVQPSAAGAQGVMQLMPDTAKLFGVTDPNDVNQNVDAGTRYFAALLQRYSDPKLALAAYNAGPGKVTNSIPNIPETQNYVKSISDAIGLDNIKQTAPVSISNPMDDKDWTADNKQDPTIPAKITEFNAMLSAHGGNYRQALSDMSNPQSKNYDPDTANYILKTLGGWDNINKEELNRQLATDQAKLTQNIAGKNQIAENTHQEAIKFTNEQFGYHSTKDGSLIDPNTITVTPDMLKMSEQQLEQYYAQQGIKVPPLFAAAYQVAHYDQDMKHAFPTRVWAGSIGEADAQTAISNIVKTINPEYDDTLYAAKPGIEKWATSGKGGDQIQALNTLHDHTQDFIDNINQLGNIDYKFLNTPINKLKSETSSPALAQTLTRMLAVRTEYMNVLNNQHALKEEDIKDADQLLNENQSPAVWAGVLNQINHTADLRGAETNERYKSVYFRDMPNYRPPAQNSTQSNLQNNNNTQPQNQPKSFVPQPGNKSLYPRVSRDGTIGIGPDGKKYIIATGQLQQ